MAARVADDAIGLAESDHEAIFLTPLPQLLGFHQFHGLENEKGAEVPEQRNCASSFCAAARRASI